MVPCSTDLWHPGWAQLHGFGPGSQCKVLYKLMAQQRALRGPGAADTHPLLLLLLRPSPSATPAAHTEYQLHTCTGVRVCFQERGHLVLLPIIHCAWVRSPPLPAHT